MRSLRLNMARAAIEVVVIVIGVLVALAVDEWRNEREDRHTEAEYLERIREDLQADIDRFARLEQVFEIKAQIIRNIKDYPTSDVLALPTAKLIEDLSFSTYVALPDSMSTTFDELLSTGRLALIENIERWDALSQYYSGFQHISEILFAPVGDYKRLLHETLPPELFDRGSLEVGQVRPRNLRDELERLVSDPGFDAAANAEIVYATSLLYYLRQYQDRAEEILELLYEEG